MSLNFISMNCIYVKNYGNNDIESKRGVNWLIGNDNSRDKGEKRKATLYALPHFRYCSLIWHFCGKRNTEKLEYLNRRILIYIFQDKESSYDDLLSETNISTLYNAIKKAI
jgi:hypothetical protein